MRKLVVLLAGVACLLGAAPARAEIGTADAVPAATLLLPYFEVDLGDPNGVDTVLSVNNASATATVANVTVWTDWGVASLGFQVYLTGYDVQTISMREVFGGQLPLTADAGSDPTDTISNKGDLSQDINFPGSVGPCAIPYNAPDPGAAAKFDNFRKVHQGLASPLNGLCWGAAHGDAIARGYVTVDTVTQCSLLTPKDPGYFPANAGIASAQNILWGDWAILESPQNVAYGETLVHVESCASGGGYLGYAGNGAGFCPLVPGDHSFYERYVAGTASDQREPLATTFAARYQGLTKTDLLVWRDPKLPPSGTNGARACGSSPAWFPLSQSDVVAFDNEENPADMCTGGDVCFPLATQRVSLKTGNALADPVKPPFSAGWLYLNLNHVAAGDPLPGVAQGWVVGLRRVEGRYGNGSDALQLDNALTTAAGGNVLIP